MTTWLNYHHLYLFKCVVEEGSIVRASEKLRMGQPSISMQIKLLEEQLDRELFERRNKKLIPTEQGKIVYEYASRIFNLGDELITTLDDQTPTHIKIQIGVQSSVPKNLISKLTSYIYKHFDSEVSVFDGSMDETIYGIINHKLDIALLNHRPITSNKSILYSKKVLESQVVLAAAPKFAYLRNKPIRDFQSIPLILPASSSPLRQSIEYYFNMKSMQINMVGEAVDTVVQKNMAISGNGVVAIMKDAVENYVKSKQLIILKEMEGITDEVWLISAKRDMANPIASKLIKDFSL